MSLFSASALNRQRLAAVGVVCGLALLAGIAAPDRLAAHGPGNAVTWNREVVRVFHEKCVSCHRSEGTASPLLTFQDVQPHGTAIKDAVLARRMPPWGAVKGFGQFRNDFSLSQEQIELITKWVDGGARRGNNPAMLPKPPAFVPPAPPAPLRIVARVSGRHVLERPLTIDGLVPERVPAEQSLRIVARIPGGRVEPLIWLHNYDSRYSHPFLFRRAIVLPAGSVIEGVPTDVTIALVEE
jgi:hypothetical protein